MLWSRSRSRGRQGPARFAFLIVAGAWSHGAAVECPTPTEGMRSGGQGQHASYKVENMSPVDLIVKWVDFEGKEVNIGFIASHSTRAEQTYVGHAFRYYSADDPSILLHEKVVDNTFLAQPVQIRGCGDVKAAGSGSRAEEFEKLAHDQSSPCEPEGKSERWSCIRRTKQADYAARPHLPTWGFKSKEESVSRAVGEIEDNGYTRHISQMPRVTTGPGYLKMNMTRKMQEVLLPWFREKWKDPHFIRDEGVIGGGYTNNHLIMTKHINLDHHPEVHHMIMKEMRHVLEWWTQQDLEHESTFGVRIYQRESMLLNHVDRADTHIASAVLQVAQDVDADGGWPLEVINGQGDCSEVFMQPGEMVLYEGGRFKHGRPMRFRGNWFANIFTHFKPLDWHGPGRSPNFVSKESEPVEL